MNKKLDIFFGITGIIITGIGLINIGMLASHPNIEPLEIILGIVMFLIFMIIGIISSMLLERGFTSKE